VGPNPSTSFAKKSPDREPFHQVSLTDASEGYTRVIVSVLRYQCLESVETMTLPNCRVGALKSAEPQGAACLSLAIVGTPRERLRKRRGQGHKNLPSATSPLRYGLRQCANPFDITPQTSDQIGVAFRATRRNDAFDA